MNPQDGEDMDLKEQAALYAAGALPPDEAARFAERLERDESARRELSALAPVLEALFRAAPALAPSAGVREALVARATQSGVIIRRADEDDWHDFGLPGVRRRWLFRDPAGKTTTFMLRMDPGSILPPHHHHGVEECYVLAGEVDTMDTRLHPGDYFRAPAGSEHGPSVTKGGCLLLLQTTLPETLTK